MELPDDTPSEPKSHALNMPGCLIKGFGLWSQRQLRCPHRLAKKRWWPEEVGEHNVRVWPICGAIASLNPDLLLNSGKRCAGGRDGLCDGFAFGTQWSQRRSERCEFLAACPCQRFSSLSVALRGFAASAGRLQPHLCLRRLRFQCANALSCRCQ